MAETKNATTEVIMAKMSVTQNTATTERIIDPPRSAAKNVNADANAAVVTVTLLGSAQDGGLPQPGCYAQCCERARADPSCRRRMPVALGITGSDGSKHLVEASRCLGDQLDLWIECGTYPLPQISKNASNDTTSTSAGSVDTVSTSTGSSSSSDDDNSSSEGSKQGRRCPVDSITLTHAHLGHVDGLCLFGREVIGAKGLPVHCSASLKDGLVKNPVWNAMIKQGCIVPKAWDGKKSDSDSDKKSSDESSAVLEAFVPGSGEPHHGGTNTTEKGEGDDSSLASSIKAGFTVRPVPVPHRAELSDTHAFVFEGVKSGRRLLFLPDHDSWDKTLEAVGCASIREWFEEKLDVDIALLDGTFFDPQKELGDVRDVSEIPHPPVSETLVKLGRKKKRRDFDYEGKERRYIFVHLNHTNPLCDPDSVERKLVEEEYGWEVASERDVFYL